MGGPSLLPTCPSPKRERASPWPQGPAPFHCQRILETCWNSSGQAPVSGDCPGLALQAPHRRTLSSRKAMLWPLSQEVRSCMSEALPPTRTAVSCSRSFCRKGFPSLPQHVVLALFMPARSSLDFSCTLSVLASWCLQPQAPRRT